MINFEHNYSVLNDAEKAKYKFKQCERCKFYPCELIDGYVVYQKNNPHTDLFSYNPNEMDGCVMRRNLAQVKRGAEYVSDGIGDDFKINVIEVYKFKKHYYSKIEESTDRKEGERAIGIWEPSQAVFISAQTGKGKNYFIEETLLEYVRVLNIEKKTNHRVLILSNRIALRLQIDDRLKTGNDFPDFEDEESYSIGEYADVMMYQGFLNKVGYYKKKQQSSKSSYIFVICDEAHFFTSDSMFNPYTSEILSAITDIFRTAIRVYLSATPYECLPYIIDYEKKNYSPSPDMYNNEYSYTLPALYHFERDYSYLDIKYYTDFDELKYVIEKANKENWLVFIDNKNKCKSLKDELEEFPSLTDKVYTVSRESKSDSKYKQMVKKERIDVGKIDKINVLIATSVIDNGVNFRNIQNVVISDISKVKCLQMLGRARVDGDERVTLYIKRVNADDVEKWLKDLENQRGAYHLYVMAKNNGNEEKMKFFAKYYNGQEKDWKDAKHWFGRNIDNPAHVYPNSIAYTLVDDLVKTYTNILEELKIDKKGQNYLEYQLSWFGKEYCKENDITLIDRNEGKNKIINFLKSYKDGNIGATKSEQVVEFREKFMEIHDFYFERMDKNKERDYGITKMNKILLEHSIKFIIFSDRGTWRILQQSE